MGLFFNSSNDIYTMVYEYFGETTNYLVVLKDLDVKRFLINPYIDKLYAAFESGRNYILYFDNLGLHEKELSFSNKAPFLLMPWEEITDFDLTDKGNRLILKINHLGKTYAYKISFNNFLLKGNRQRLAQLQAVDFYRPKG